MEKAMVKSIIESMPVETQKEMLAQLKEKIEPKPKPSQEEISKILDRIMPK